MAREEQRALSDISSSFESLLPLLSVEAFPVSSLTLGFQQEQEYRGEFFLGEGGVVLKSTHEIR